VHGPVVWAYDGLGQVAPEMARRDLIAFLVGESFCGCGTDIEGFRAKMFAKSAVHDFSLSI
jgi:hypothetical protein